MRVIRGIRVPRMAKIDIPQKQINFVTDVTKLRLHIVTGALDGQAVKRRIIFVMCKFFAVPGNFARLRIAASLGAL